MKNWSHQEESENLRVRFKALKNDKNIGQAEFARAHDVPGGPSLLSQHILNRRPINLEAAKAYAKGFGCSIAEISPRLWRELEEANTISGDATGHRLAWTPKAEPEYLAVKAKEIANAVAVPGYSTEALALAWLLDQVTDRLDKKSAETEASAVILRYVNKIAATPTHTPDEH